MNQPVQITPNQPITRGEKVIKTVTLNKPTTGALRGMKLADVLQMDVDAITRLLPRISEPALTEADVATLDPADFTSLALEVVGFLTGERPSP